MIIKESCCKIAVWSSDILIFSFDIPLDFHESIWVVPLKYLMNFLPVINNK